MIGKMSMNLLFNVLSLEDSFFYPEKFKNDIPKFSNFFNSIWKQLETFCYMLFFFQFSQILNFQLSFGQIFRMFHFL